MSQSQCLYRLGEAQILRNIVDFAAGEGSQRAHGVLRAWRALSKENREVAHTTAKLSSVADHVSLSLRPSACAIRKLKVYTEQFGVAIKKVTFAFMLAALNVAATRNFSSRYSKHKLILAKGGWEKMHDCIFKIMQPARAGPRVQLLLAIDVLFARDPRVIKDASRPSYDFKTNEVMVYSILEELYA